MMRLLAIGVVALGWMGSRVPAGAQEKDGPEKIVLDLGGGVKMEFVKIKAGKFTMGGNENDNEKPPHEVTITKDYWMQTTETTQSQWEAVMGKNPSHFKGADLPVETVSWEDCQEFLKKLNEKAKEQLKGRAAKFPTEAEWEYACRAGEKGTWCFGDEGKKLGEYAWYYKNSDAKMHPVGQKKANAWGLYDMHGNAWEWCEDWYEAYPSEAVTDATGPAKGDSRCLRGGCWHGIAYSTRSALRLRDDPTNHDFYVGFRAASR
ncbi:MAG: formylglycine-generating enzyme family protein [Planctomycetes bacterium]|nr:formylglycine-generating enzyme family protein [Planctomycetota bacterium]